MTVAHCTVSGDRLSVLPIPLFVCLLASSRRIARWRDVKTNETHDPSMKSWVDSANDAGTDFPIQNLALCSFERSHDGHTHDHMGVRIGEEVLDVSMLWESGFFDQDADLAGCLRIPYWGAVADVRSTWGPLRRMIQQFLRADAHVGQQGRRLRQKAVLSAKEQKFTLPPPR